FLLYRRLAASTCQCHLFFAGHRRGPACSTLLAARDSSGLGRASRYARKQAALVRTGGRAFYLLTIAMAATALAITGWAAELVSYERLLKSDAEPANWLMYSGNYQSYRYSRLDQITTANVTRLRPKR